jgi:endonuclease/exonuclease/phosphatase family metal-dependent hydrolase
MTASNNKTLLNAVLTVTVLAFVAACSDSGNNNNNKKDQTIRTDSLAITSYNVGLALNFVPFTNERLVVNERLLADSDSDVICLQEVWLEEQVEALSDALEATYPEIYTVPPEQIFSETAACSNEDIDEFAQCLNNQCPGLTGPDFVSCAPVQCSEPAVQLPPVCLDAVLASVGIPDVSAELLVEAVTQPAGKFAFGGSLGLILASKYPLEDREFQDFIDDSSANHRGALYAQINLNNQAHVVGCTHPTANLSQTIDYPTSGKHGSWEGENRFMQEQMIAFANNKAGDNPILFAGDFNCSIANASNGVDADFPENCELWLRNGFTDPAADQLRCTFCSEENLILQAEGGSGDFFLDHIFIKNVVTATPIVAERVFDDPVSIEATVPPSELQPADSPAMTHPSDHFGVELQLRLP